MRGYKFKELLLMGLISSFLLNPVVYAAPEDDERAERLPSKSTIKNLKTIFHSKSYAEVLDYLIKKNAPTLKMNFCHKPLSQEEFRGEIQYCIAYTFLVRASVSFNFEQAEKNLKAASKWNQKALRKGNEDAKKLFEMAREIGPQVINPEQFKL